MKEETAQRVRAGDTGASTTFRSFACTEHKRRMIIAHLDRLAPYQRAIRDERPYGGSSRSSWRGITMRNEPQEGESDHRHHKHSPRKRRKGGMPVGYSRTAM
jgi:hypothetical protein